MKMHARTKIKRLVEKFLYPITVAAIVLLPTLSFATEENTSPDTIQSIVTRDDGYHAIFLGTTQFPNSDVCTLNDRGIVIESDSASRTMVAIALAAMLNKSTATLRTDGCVITKLGTTTTAPKVIKIKVDAPD